ncbi:Protein of uncharacterised function (DUF3383) [Buttiauxella agrestis]|uniref:Protein of uncharacterized function (DUF3383) n=1 Tax=Buttiauxella agrestis TaxID=82977 RepID=A0A381C6E6_9ENTR|nr:DUF3383 domain-containing protein [Buttiauxella agrestis]SUW63478.1 Protein of uncharacterised function (DUF3383) [Buttiauxella agrestis]
MSISIKKYVDITSGVGGSAAVKERELILRLFTKDTKVPAGVVMEFTDLNDVATTFGTTSEEYKRAALYFGFVSKMITKAKKLSFAHYNDASAPASPAIVGGTALTTIATWKAITDGSVRIEVGPSDYLLDDLDFSSAAALADVAGTIQTKLQTILIGATVTYDGTGQKFNASFVGHDAPAAVSVIASGSGADIADNLGWTTAKGMVTSPGSNAMTALDYIIEADEISDNYGSFACCGAALDHDVVQSIAAWNNAQNVKYQYLVPVTKANYVAWYGTLMSYSGCALTIVNDGNTEFDEMIPGIILGSTDYNQRNASQNFMFQQVAGFTPKVDSNTEANDIDTNTRVNYYGRTKNAGQPIDLYQNGYLCGTSTSPLQMNVYANEQWFKSAAVAVLMTGLLSLPIIPATEEGRAIVISLLNGGDDAPIPRALFNGTIKAEKDLTVTQKAYVTQVTGDPLAWHQVQSIGWWLDAQVLQEAQTNGTIKYVIDYTLVYSKADAVNKITGRDILI